MTERRIQQRKLLLYSQHLEDFCKTAEALLFEKSTKNALLSIITIQVSIFAMRLVWGPRTPACSHMW